MIKKIAIDQLKIGMYVKDLDCGWMDHPFLVGSFKIKDDKSIKKISASGIKHAYIDATKGVDVDDQPTLAEVKESSQEEINNVAKNAKKADRNIEGKEEASKARAIYQEATNVIHNMMEDVRMGKQVEVEAIDPLAERMIQSVVRNQHAFSGITRIKTKDEYTFMHCVSVAGLMVTFARSLNFSESVIHQVAIGGLVHDVGKILVPDKVLNKPGKLTDEEFVVMKDHVTHSREILADNLGISNIARDVALLHHERADGTGYPLGLAGDEINIIGKMSAIVDVYDALTSVRVYKDAWDPGETLKKMLEWSPGHFSRPLVEKFIECLGIYPVGTLVELESGKLGIVTDQGEDMLRPSLRLIYNAKKQCYLKVTDMNLAKHKNDRIISSILPSKYNIDISAFF